LLKISVAVSFLPDKAVSSLRLFLKKIAFGDKFFYTMVLSNTFFLKRNIDYDENSSRGGQPR
ncbi:MAG: hypothetical protein LRY50_12425, partial [Geovibrio sp.]|nr:hypothetical protein [Geovibrio sp.]